MGKSNKPKPSDEDTKVEDQTQPDEQASEEVKSPKPSDEEIANPR